MVIDGKIRKKLIELFKGVEYRKIVSQRAACHPNTVTNVLVKGTSNLKVEVELLQLAKEIQLLRNKEAALLKRAKAIVKKL